MSIPLRQNMRMAAYLMRQRIKGTQKYPLIVELEPLFVCNLACPGCGKIQYPTEILRKRLSPQDAADDYLEKPFFLKDATRRIKRMIDRIVEQRAKGNLLVVETTIAKLIFKGVNPKKFTSASADDPDVEAKLREIAADMGVSLWRD